MKKDYKRKGENTRKKPLNFSKENVLIIIIEISQLDCHDQNYMHVINKLKVAKLFADRLWFSSLRTKYMVVQFCMLDTSYILRSYTNIQYVNVSMQHNNINFMQNITQFIDPEVKSFHVKKKYSKNLLGGRFSPICDIYHTRRLIYIVHRHASYQCYTNDTTKLHKPRQIECDMRRKDFDLLDENFFISLTPFLSRLIFLTCHLIPRNILCLTDKQRIYKYMYFFLYHYRNHTLQKCLNQ